MFTRSHTFSLFLVLALVVSLTACDQSSQNFDFQEGSSLTVRGPANLTLSESDGTATGEYYVRAFTIKQDYNWSASGSAQIMQVRRDGEYVDVSFSEPGSYDVTVTTTIDGEQYSGTQTTEVSAP